MDFVFILKKNISILVVLLYAWRISVNIKKYGDLEDVYYGVQIAYFAIIATQLSMIVLSIVLLVGIHKENVGLVVPWIIGFICFMALEAVAMVYSNVLRDHVNRQFDALCKAEVAFFMARAFINVSSTGRRQNDEMRRNHEVTINIENSDDDDDDEDVHMTDDAEKSAASGSDEDDSLLVAYDSNSVASV
ncbi:hypothetical protein HA402_012730 [Bradysia odoriphaga]|nr:hypothetical protein HA402_012730 [Bradysia odoriphaga]